MVTTPQLNFDSPGRPPGFKVLIAYEDLATGLRAKQTYDFLVEHLNRDFQFTVEMWKFNVLGIGELREIAASDAVTADLIILSTRGTRLPDHVRTWIQDMLPLASNLLALAALFICGREGPAQIRDTGKSLEEAARFAQVAFFVRVANSSAAASANRCFERAVEYCVPEPGVVIPLPLLDSRL